jgi:hypothetical protein
MKKISSSLPKFDIYDQVVKVVKGKTFDYKDGKSEYYLPIVEFLISFVKSKLNIDMHEAKIMSIFESISKMIEPKIIAKDEVLFSKGDPITGLYILINGRIGLSKCDKEKLSYLKSKNTSEILNLSQD